MTKPWFPIVTPDDFFSNDEVKQWWKPQPEEDDEKPTKFENLIAAEHWLLELEKRVERTIDAAENVMELDENDIKAIMLSHATRMLGISVDAQRSNDLDDLILANLIC